ncbi:MAG: hydroxyethylthiazole kinase, partial [Candidatus Accumulibacter sp.]|nr:hydroxyethylthiazole kinase [Accumulibacter sp.]
MKTLRAADAAEFDSGVGAALAAVRARGPLIHCLGNSPARELMANVVLALGGSPAMVSDADEAAALAPAADALVINLASLTPPLAAAMRRSAAAFAGRPWLLDPAAIGRLPLRTELARELLELKPSVVKG